MGDYVKVSFFWQSLSYKFIEAFRIFAFTDPPIIIENV